MPQLKQRQGALTARKTSRPEELPPPKLVENREVAHQKIQSQIEKGQQYWDRSINSLEELDELYSESLVILWGNLIESVLRRFIKEGGDLPSDIQGIVYVRMDDGEDCRFKLAREMKVAGLPIDMNDV